MSLAAGLGAAGVIFAGHDTLWRIVGTCAATAMGALLVLGSSSLLERDETWPAGAMSALLFVGEYLLTLGLIWEVFGQAEEQASLTALFVALTGFPALVFVGILRQPVAFVAARVPDGRPPGHPRLPALQPKADDRGRQWDVRGLRARYCRATGSGLTG